MVIRVGTENISDVQLRELRRIQGFRVGSSSRRVAQILNVVVEDSDIVSGDEDLHPEWISIFKRHRERLGADMGRERFEYLRRAFDSLEPIDSLISTIDPEQEQIALLLGAGASKPGPSDIPTVTELLPELLRRARRLDREQVTSLADFCDKRGIDNIEDLLTAVQISAFCSRNPGILSLVEFQLFGEDNREGSGRRINRGSIHTEVSSVAYLQDTLQVLFGALV